MSLAAVLNQTTRRLEPASRGLRKVFRQVVRAPANWHSQFSSGAALSASSGFSRPDPARVPMIVVASGGVAFTMTIVGLNILGTSMTQTIAATGEGSFYGTRALAEITSISTNVDPQATVDLKMGCGFALPEAFESVERFAVDGVLASLYGSHGDTGTILIDPSTPPDGTREFAVTYIPLF